MSDDALFASLSGLLRPYAGEMIVKTDTDGHLYLEETRSQPRPQMFGAVQAKKNYTAFHLFPLYTHPELLDGLSPELKKRMQGKSCFNFTRLDQVPISQLTALVQRAHATL